MVSGSNKETKKDDMENTNAQAKNQPVAATTAMVTPVIPQITQTQQTFGDTNGQQFVMMPVQMGQNPLIQYAPENVPKMFSTQPVRGRGQLRGRRRSGRFGRDLRNIQVFSMLIAWIVHL